jgi:hypothetical protein
MRYRETRLAKLSIFLLFLTAILPGCVLKEPLSNPDEAKPDERLFGAWKFEGPDKKQREYWILAIGKAELRGAPPGILKAIEISNDGHEKIQVRDYYFFATFLGKENYANILGEVFSEKDKPKSWEKIPAKEWLLVRYAVADDRLTMWLMNGGEAKIAITRGELKGSIEEKGFLKIESTRMAGGKDLASFLSNGGHKKLFTDETKQVFSRIK